MDGGDAPAFFVAGNPGWASFPLARGSGRKWREVAWTAPFPDQAAVKGSLEKMRKKAPGDGDGPDDPAVPPDGASFLVIRGTPPDGPVVHLV